MKNNRTAVTLTVIFFALLLLPQVICLFDRQQTDVASENRNLARFPRLKWSRFASEFEEYYNDRIPFRNRMLKYCRNIQCKLFAFTLGTAIAGKEDFCFYSPKNKKNAFLQHAGKIRYTAYEMKKIHKYLEKLNQYLHAHNIDFLLVIPPDKIQVYPEHLPERRRYAESPYAPIPSLRKYLNERSSKVPRLFLVDDLLQAKKICGNDLFYRADSHWNKVGGYIGAAAVIRKLSPETVLPSPGEFKIITENIPEPNDLKNQLLQAGLIKEYMEKSPDVPAVAAAIPKAYSVNKNPAAKDKRKVLIYRDSFTTNMSPWLSNHFQEIHYVWTQRVSKKQIAQIKPDIVIIECLSRLMIDIKCDLK